MSTTDDPRRELRHLYGRAHGYLISDDEADSVARTGSAATYGELTPAGTVVVLDWFGLGPDDVFFDLGSGIGKVVMLAALATPARAVVGVELVGSRNAIALERLGRAIDSGLVEQDRVEFRRADMLRTPLHAAGGSAATCVYACSTAYPTEVMNRLVRRLARMPVGLRFVTLQDLDENPWFKERDELRVATSWKRGAKAYCYELVRPYGYTRRGRASGVRGRRGKIR